MNHYILFTIAVLASIMSTLIVRKLAVIFNIVDKPGLERKIHTKSTPLLGGIGIFISFFLILFFLKDFLLVGDLEINHWLGFFLGGLVLIIGGALDDKYNLKPGIQIIFPILAILIVLIFGINIEKISNPIDGTFIYLNLWEFPLYIFSGKIIYFSLISSFVIFLWLMGMMYTTKLLDGVDGLVSGVTMIGAIIIYLFTITPKYFQPDIALASLILAACCFGFLVFNWNPASIFLGEGGSLFLGYALGVLAIISGGKIAIALLVMGIPILDVIWTITRRLKKGKNPFKFSDREHLHFRLLDTGIGQRKTVLIYYFIALIFGLSAIVLQSIGKFFALGVLILLMMAIIIFFKKRDLCHSLRALKK